MGTPTDSEQCKHPHCIFLLDRNLLLYIS
uniref:Uncharacterized protein n=1 Tax=Arundo donax TaxID=35708 RepID=A0A0A8Z0K6_ARUDO